MPQPPPPPVQTIREGRCHMCGYSLRGLPAGGRCPECGSSYDSESATRLKPWPSALAVCVRLGWPIAGLLLAVALMAAGRQPRAGTLAVQGTILGWAMVGALAVNSYLQVRSMLKSSLPHNVRTRGLIAGLRHVGATICLVVFVGFVGLPLMLFLAVMVAFSQCLKSSGH